MARSHLTLAALATAAVAGLDIVHASTIGTPGSGEFDSALLTDRDGKHWIIRRALTERAGVEQSTDLVALQALSTGVRSRLPFGVPTYAGQAPIDDGRVVVYHYVYGTPIALADLRPGGVLATSIGTAIAAIHTLPTSFVVDAGLPSLTPSEALASSLTVLDRASATGLVPAALLERWEAATNDAALWQFAPTVINGAMTSDSFLATDGEVTGVLGWHGLSVGDPALDLFWLLGANQGEVVDTAFDAYNLARGSSDRQILQRATLYAELELAKWLLHGTAERDTEIVDDAVAMLHGRLDSVQGDLNQNITHNTMPVLNIDEVQELLKRRDGLS
ncbi:MAG: phosphotransferase [Terrimesophilobacter sp.]